MMLRRVFWVSLLAVFLVSVSDCGAWAFTRPVHAHFTATVSPAPAPGSTVTVTVQATVDPGWHVYSVIPANNGPFPTDLTDAGPGWTPAGPDQENAPIKFRDPNFGVDVAYHEKAATFERQFKVTDLVSKPTLTIHFQTCNAKVCLPPDQVVVPLTVSTAAPPSLGAIAPARPTGGAGPTSGSGGGLGLFLLGAFGAGLLTLLTPCVFPLVPITLTAFVKQADGDKARLVRLSAGYATGIVLLYVGLGLLVTALAGAAGLNRLGANPWVNLVIFALFIVFALSFFETITLTLPVNLGALQESGRRHGGVIGLGLLGIAFVLASFTCIAPFVGTLLVASAGGPTLRPTLGLLAFAVAFALPFFVFALFPQWIARIPKSGAWLARVKATLGFIELAAALKFLSNADLYWQWHILTQPVLLAAWSVIFVCATLYLAGPLRFGPAEEAGPVSGGRRIFAGLFAVMALYLFWGLSGRPIRLLETYLPPAGYGGAAAPGAEKTLPWLTDYGQALALAQAENKPLLIDFTGYFCTNCRYNENNVFPNADVQREMNDYVRVQLYTDGQHDAANQALQLAKFKDISLPLYGVLDPNTQAPIAQTAGVVTANGFTQFLSQARATAVASRE